MIACRLFEHYPFPLLFFLFLWLSAVRMHTHPWAKESKIDHTSNWSRCTGTGSSSRADLSHAGKIMHPELTAQHTRLPSTSFLKCSRNLTIGRKQGGEYWDPTLVLPINDSWTWYGSSAGFVRALRNDLMSIHWLQRLWLIHCVMWTAGNGITFVEGREDNTVTLDNGLAMNRNRPCQAVSASVFQLHTTTDTLYQSLFAFSPHFLPPSAKTAPFLIRPSCVWRAWLHWFWQVPINTSLLYVASIFDLFFLFFFAGEHLAPCVAVWRLTQPVISSLYSWLIFDSYIYYWLICKWLIQKDHLLAQ